MFYSILSLLTPFFFVLFIYLACPFVSVKEKRKKKDTHTLSLFHSQLGQCESCICVTPHLPMLYFPFLFSSLFFSPILCICILEHLSLSLCLCVSPSFLILFPFVSYFILHFFSRVYPKIHEPFCWWIKGPDRKFRPRSSRKQIFFFCSLQDVISKGRGIWLSCPAS